MKPLTSLDTGKVELRLLGLREYRNVNPSDPIRYYHLPIIGKMYRRRVELCLSECRRGLRVLEVGFGSGLTFLNLAELYEEIWGVDIAADCNAVKALYKRHGVRAHLQNGSILSLPLPNDSFDTVLLISILEHLRPAEQTLAFSEIHRVLKPGGQLIYGVPVERPLMVLAFRCLGYNIRKLHFSTHQDVSRAASQVLEKVRIVEMNPLVPALGSVYQVGHFVRPGG